jgi:glutamate decarboxylase
MVHLASVPNDDQVKKHHKKSTLTKGMEAFQLGPIISDEDTYTTTVYGSKYAAEDLPKYEMPEHEMPKEVAYKMIKDDLSLDGNPMLK